MIWMLMGFLVALGTKGDKILGYVISQASPRLNVMDLKSFDASARLATPAVPLQDLPAKLVISSRLKSQAWAFGTQPAQIVACTSSTSRIFSGFGRPSTRRVREDNKATPFPVSKLTPARKSAQIISKQ